MLRVLQVLLHWVYILMCQQSQRNNLNIYLQDGLSPSIIFIDVEGNDKGKLNGTCSISYLASDPHCNYQIIDPKKKKNLNLHNLIFYIYIYIYIYSMIVGGDGI